RVGHNIAHYACKGEIQMSLTPCLCFSNKLRHFTLIRFPCILRNLYDGKNLFIAKLNTFTYKLICQMPLDDIGKRKAHQFALLYTKALKKMMKIVNFAQDDNHRLFSIYLNAQIILLLWSCYNTRSNKLSQ